MSRPIVVIPACTKLIEGYVFDAVGRKYSAAVAEVAECQPLLIPVGPGMSDIGAVLEVADAILLTGQPLERRARSITARKPRSCPTRSILCATR